MYSTIISSLLIVNAVLASYQAIHAWRDRNRSDNLNVLLSLIAFSSALWSLCFGLIYATTSTDFARICRGVGLVGVFLYLMAAEILISEFTTIRRGTKHFFYLLGATGFFLIPFISSKEGAEYFLTDHGMAFTMPNSVANTLYSVYCIVLDIIIFGFIINIIATAKNKRTRILGHSLLMVGIVITVGMVADTILPPIIGITSFPASSIMQFWGVALIIIILHIHERSSITVDNMSNFIYYSISVPVILYDNYLNPCISNDAVYTFLGRDRLTTGNSELTLEAMFGISSKQISESSDSHFQFETKCLPNKVMCRVTIDSITDRFGDILGYIVNIEDISAHTLALEKVEEARTVAEESNRSKSVFLANISHEIRTPMNSIVGFTELLLNSDLPDEEKGYVSDIKRASESLLEIIRNVLDMSEIETGTLKLHEEDVDTADMLHDICRIIEPQVTVKDVIFKVDIAEDLPRVFHGDSGRIKEIMTNLLGNSIRNTSLGSISLSVSKRQGTDKSTILHIEIQDTGKGFRPEEVQHLFETFSQVDGHVHEGIEGSGLEFALTKSYVTYMNGQINVISKYGYGTNFVVDIPLNVVDATEIGAIDWSSSPAIESALSHEQAGFEHLKVLVVDDSKINVKVFSHILRTCGIEADCVYNGEDSIAKCKEEEYNIIFMDQMMPGMDGIEAMKKIRAISDHYATGNKCQIVAFTANAVAGVSESLIKEGFDSYMSKPIDLKALEVVLNRS